MKQCNNYNKSNNLSMSLVNDIVSICHAHPVFNEINAHSFVFHRLYNDGSRMFFCSSHEWTDHFYKKNYFAASSFQKFYHSKEVMLWKEWPLNDLSFIKLINDAKENFNFSNGIIINKKHNNYIDSFALRGFAYDEGINDRYFSQFVSIEQFIDHFLDKSKKIIDTSFKNRLVIPENVVKLYNVENVSDTKEHINAVLNNFFGKKLFIDNNGLFFSVRESECLVLLVLGRSMKEIADKLCISMRTVEFYINNIKFKLQCGYKSQIIENLSAHHYNKNIILDIFKAVF